jgi:hypothetical protein
MLWLELNITLSVIILTPFHNPRSQKLSKQIPWKVAEKVHLESS